LTPLMTVDAKMSQMMYLPTWVLSQSMPRENLSKACMWLSPKNLMGTKKSCICRSSAEWGKRFYEAL
jgi:hypothetical protein